MPCWQAAWLSSVLHEAFTHVAVVRRPKEVGRGGELVPLSVVGIADGLDALGLACLLPEPRGIVTHAVLEPQPNVVDVVDLAPAPRCAPERERHAMSESRKRL
jgi:hypothetical protein